MYKLLILLACLQVLALGEKTRCLYNQDVVYSIASPRINTLAGGHLINHIGVNLLKASFRDFD
jgi:hypothetical protein